MFPFTPSVVNLKCFIQVTVRARVVFVPIYFPLRPEKVVMLFEFVLVLGKMDSVSVLLSFSPFLYFFFSKSMCIFLLFFQRVTINCVLVGFKKSTTKAQRLSFL